MGQQLPDSENYFKKKKRGMSAMIVAQLATIHHDSFIDSCCDAVYVGPPQPISGATAIDERVTTAKPDTFIKIYKKGRVDDLPVRMTVEPLSKNLLGIGALCDLGWKLKVIIVQRVWNLY
jgi:hypothetical protein